MKPMFINYCFNCFQFVRPGKPSPYDSTSVIYSWEAPDITDDFGYPGGLKGCFRLMLLTFLCHSYLVSPDLSKLTPS